LYQPCAAHASSDDVPRGEYAVSTMPFAAHRPCRSFSGRNGCSSTWFVAGTTLVSLNSCSRSGTPKLDTPMDLHLPTRSVSTTDAEDKTQSSPVASSFSISFHVSTMVGLSEGSSVFPARKQISSRIESSGGRLYHQLRLAASASGTCQYIQHRAWIATLQRPPGRGGASGC
jgi:hypothetical protein